MNIQRYEEEEILNIKKALDDELIYREDQKFVFDYGKIIEENPEIYDLFSKHPETFIQTIKQEIKDRYDIDPIIRYVNLREEELISNLRVEHLGKVVKTTGMLSNATGVMALVKERTFECISCGAVIHRNKPNPPKICSCGKKNNFKTIKTYYQNIQEIVLEENQDEIGDRSPRRTRIRLTEELCDKEFNGIVKDGNKIEVVGIVEEIPLKKDNLTNEEIYQFRIFALQIRSLENEFDETISEEDVEEIERISYENPLKQLSNSLAPAIIGHEDVKKSLIISMVGGVPRTSKDGKKEKNRIHGLLIGDASVGKSALLQETTRKHYKSRYISGERLSEAGLGASVEKDEFLGTWVLKAGHLPKINNGLASIDELDKAEKGVQKALHTPMESGIVTIAKAGISAILNSDCTIVCGANPKNSRFDSRKSLVAQINMEETLLTRFDWIFVMRDDIDGQRDKHIAESIWEDEDAIDDLIPLTLFRKYIKYCQKFKPKVSKEARELINNFYIEIRNKAVNSEGLEGMPIVPRHLKGLRRMAEACAKIRLSDLVEKEDAKNAVDIFKSSLIKLGLEEDGTIDFARIGPGKSLNKKLKTKGILELVDKLSKNEPYIQEDTIMFECSRLGLDLDEAKRILEELHQEGELYNPRYNVWAKTK